MHARCCTRHTLSHNQGEGSCPWLVSLGCVLFEREEWPHSMHSIFCMQTTKTQVKVSGDDFEGLSYNNLHIIYLYMCVCVCFVAVVVS